MDVHSNLIKHSTLLTYRTVFECSVRCLSDLCFGYKLNLETMTCTTLEIAPGEVIFVGPPENTTQLWLRRGHMEKVSTVAALQETSLSFLEYSLSPNPNKTYLGIPDFTESQLYPVHHAFDWGLLMCAVGSKKCKKWLYGSKEWEDAPPMLRKHASTLDYNQVGMINNSLWAIGGYASARRLSCTEYYSPDGQWVLGHNLPHTLSKFGVAPISDSQVVIVGGIMKGTYQNNIKLFDLVNGTWSTIAKHPHTLIMVACARHILLNGKAVVICTGGQSGTSNESPINNLTITGVFDINSGIWNLTPEWDLPMKCSGPRMRVLDDRLFIMGGTFEDGRNNRVLEFKEGETPVWKELQSLPSTDNIKSVISIESSIWIPDYRDSNDNRN